ncbi:MAG TPA: nuclear transport factor 2 family protein [Terracidiphilus sp.]|nr:nuclear transport factor 2 family protein [Terracidiphilus sp.]
MRGLASRAWTILFRLRAIRAISVMLLVGIATASLLGETLRAQKHERRHEIDHLEEAWRTALLKEDTAAMSALLADNYMAITPSGTLQTKEEALANLRSGRVHVTSLEVSDRKIRFYGTTALVTSTADIQGTTAEGNITGSYRYTRVYVEGPPGVWKIVSFEANRILGPGSHK